MSFSNVLRCIAPRGEFNILHHIKTPFGGPLPSSTRRQGVRVVDRPIPRPCERSPGVDSCQVPARGAMTGRGKKCEGRAVIATELDNRPWMQIGNNVVEHDRGPRSTKHAGATWTRNRERLSHVSKLRELLRRRKKHAIAINISQYEFESELNAYLMKECIVSHADSPWMSPAGAECVVPLGYRTVPCTIWIIQPYEETAAAGTSVVPRRLLAN